jgi:cytochrome c peroxidase
MDLRHARRKRARVIGRAWTAPALALGLSACGGATDGNGAGGHSTSLPPTDAPRVFPNPTAPTPTIDDVAGDFDELMRQLIAAKPAIEARQQALLDERYDLSDHPSSRCAQTKGKPAQTGPRSRLSPGTTFRILAGLTPDEIRAADVFPAGFFPLPHPNQDAGGMLFPRFAIEEVLRQTGRDLTRFDLDFDLPDLFLPQFPPPIYLTTRPDLGDVSGGKLITTDNFFETFKNILNPKQIDGLRLLLTPFAQQQFNLTDDRRSTHPSLGVACFDCHANGHTDAGTHLVGDIRPQEFRHRIDTPSLRGVNIQRLFGSQRALKTVEDFTEFEQRAAYFDGDPAAAVAKGINVLDRGTQVQGMAEFQELLDFPPAAKLGLDGRLVPGSASAGELRGQDLFFGKAKCASCHVPPFYTDNLMHDLEVERFYTPRLINGMMASADGPIKTFVLRGVKDSPPYLHDGRLLTLEDVVEFFNLVLGTQLSDLEKSDLVDFMCAL